MGQCQSSHVNPSHRLIPTFSYPKNLWCPINLTSKYPPGSSTFTYTTSALNTAVGFGPNPAQLQGPAELQCPNSPIATLLEANANCLAGICSPEEQPLLHTPVYGSHTFPPHLPARAVSQYPRLSLGACCLCPGSPLDSVPVAVPVTDHPLSSPSRRLHVRTC